MTGGGAIALTTVTAGSAHAALADTVRSLKAGEPLRPVTVLVPTHAAGVPARRTLGRLIGVAAVDLITLYRLAERLAGPTLRGEGRLPVSTAVVDLAVRGVLADAPSAFDAVADHPSTVVALRDLHRELRAAGPAALTGLANASRRGWDAARVSRLTTERLGERWYDEGDLLIRSIEVVRRAPVPDALARVIVFLPQPYGPLEIELLRALAASATVHVIAALTGDDHADADLRATLATLGHPDPPVPPGGPAPGDDARVEVVSVTDADDEVRHAVRAIVDAARAGTPLSRIAVLWPADRPYARLVEHHLDVAGVVWNGRPGTRVAERLVPRFLLDLLAVDRRGLRRRDLFDLLSDVPVRDGAGHRVPVPTWERLSRAAGVVEGADWTPRLRAYAAWRDDPAADQLADHVAELRAALGPPDAVRPWSEWADWAVAQIETRLGRDLLARLGEPERQAWEHTTRVLDRLRHLDGVGEPPRRAEFRAVFESEFEVAPGRLGRIGNGVTVGSLASAAGLRAELVIVLGAAEGVLPAAPSADPLVSDADRAAAGLATADAAARRAHRQLLGVLDLADRVIVLTPRGDLRATTERQPSRWLADVPAGTPTRVVDSHVAALARAPFPAHAAEHRLRGRLVGAGKPPASDPVLARALRLRAARRSDRLTEFDGDLSGVAVPALGEHPVSPTALEAWAACPHAYFVQYLLGVRAVDEPATALTITAADRGSLVHAVLDAFHREVIAGTMPQPGPDGWGPTHLRRLLELLADVADRFERRGRTGRSAYWAVEQARLSDELRGWAAHDSLHVVARRAEVIASELSFGDEPHVALRLPDGREIDVHGVIDRVDRTPTGLVVTDHKTGGTTAYSAIGDDDPTAGGTRFQLATYAAAALQLFDDPGDVRTEYAFTRAAKYKRIGYAVTGDVWDRVAADLDRVVSGIEAGWFPPVPDKPQFELWPRCIFCQPDGLGTAPRWAEWDRKRADPRIRRWFP